MQRTPAILFLAFGLASLAGCQQRHPEPPNLSFQHGAQLLAAGSPKSAVTFLSQTVASAPADPEPTALLALAYALDVQPDAALQQAQLVKRPEHSLPGWETVAVGVAEMTRQNQVQAIASFQRVVAGPKSSKTPAARQWLVLAYVLHGEYEPAHASLDTLAATPGLKPTAMLWSVLLHSKQGHPKLAAEALVQAAAGLAKDPGALSMQGTPDDQTLYDSAVAAVAAGNLAGAQQTFDRLHQRNPEAADTATWTALLAAARGDWSGSRALLKDACETGPTKSRGFASQIYSVVCATEDRPEDLVRYMVTGQRLLARANTVRTITPAQPENVWGSDKMK